MTRTTRSNYTCVGGKCTPTRLVIKDEGPWNRFMTVSNDAEAVVAELYSLGLLSSKMDLFYYDSEGEPGRLLHKDGRFTGYAPACELEIAGGSEP